MRRMMIWAAVLMGVLACRPAPPAEPPRPEKTPAQTLYQFKWAYNAPDEALAADVLCRDGFELRAERFPKGFPRTWGYDEEMTATRSLFKRAYHIILEFPSSDTAAGRPKKGATAYTTLPIDTRLRVWRDPNYCLVARGDVVYTLVRKDAAGTWLISGLDDRTSAARTDAIANAETEPCSWTDIRWYYYRLETEGGDKP